MGIEWSKNMGIEWSKSKNKNNMGIRIWEQNGEFQGCFKKQKKKRKTHEEIEFHNSIQD